MIVHYGKLLRSSRTCSLMLWICICGSFLNGCTGSATTPYLSTSGMDIQSASVSSSSSSATSSLTAAAAASTPSSCYASGCSQTCNPACALNETCTLGLMTQCGVCPPMYCIPIANSTVSSSTAGSGTDSSSSSLLPGLVGGIGGVSVLAIAGFIIWRVRNKRKAQGVYRPGGLGTMSGYETMRFPYDRHGGQGDKDWEKNSHASRVSIPIAYIPNDGRNSGPQNRSFTSSAQNDRMFYALRPSSGTNRPLSHSKPMLHPHPSTQATVNQPYPTVGPNSAAALNRLSTRSDNPFDDEDDDEEAVVRTAITLPVTGQAIVPVETSSFSKANNDTPGSEAAKTFPSSGVMTPSSEMAIAESRAARSNTSIAATLGSARAGEAPLVPKHEYQGTNRNSDALSHRHSIASSVPPVSPGLPTPSHPPSQAVQVLCAKPTLVRVQTIRGSNAASSSTSGSPRLARSASVRTVVTSPSSEDIKPISGVSRSASVKSLGGRPRKRDSKNMSPGQSPNQETSSTIVTPESSSPAATHETTSGPFDDPLKAKHQDIESRP